MAFWKTEIGQVMGRLLLSSLSRIPLLCLHLIPRWALNHESVGKLRLLVGSISLPEPRPEGFGADGLSVSPERNGTNADEHRTAQANRADFEAEIAKRKGKAKGQAEGIVHKK